MQQAFNEPGWQGINAKIFDFLGVSICYSLLLQFSNAFPSSIGESVSPPRSSERPREANTTFISAGSKGERVNGAGTSTRAQQPKLIYHKLVVAAGWQLSQLNFTNGHLSFVKNTTFWVVHSLHVLGDLYAAFWRKSAHPRVEVHLPFWAKMPSQAILVP